MYTTLSIKNFRCLAEFAANDLQRVNLIAGLNNVGKTALLEAIFLHAGAYNPGLSLQLDAFRGISTKEIALGEWEQDPWVSIFRDFDVSRTIELTGENTSTGKRTLFLRTVEDPSELNEILPQGKSSLQEPTEPQATLASSQTTKVLELEYREGKTSGRYYMILDRKGIRTMPVVPAPPFPGFFVGTRAAIAFKEQAELYGKLEIRGEQEVLLDVLKLIEPRLKRLAVVVTAGEPTLHGDVGMGRLLPLPVMGEGMARLTALVVDIGNAPNGVVLVDEIENGLHHTVLPNVWLAIGKAAKQFNAQIFATTHSFECIQAAHRAFSDSGDYCFRLHRLELKAGNTRVVTYDEESLAIAIQNGFDVR